MPGLVSLRKRFAELLPELAKFGLVGLIGSVVDLGGAAYLHGALGIGPMVSKGLSITAATVITYLGSRFWTFRHRVNQNLLREGTLFVALNVVGLAIAECVIALVTYGFGLKGTLAYNAASLAGTGLGTIFRYFSYKKWVFLAGTPGAAVAAGEAAVSGLVDANEVAPVLAARSEPVLAARSERVLAGRSDRHQRRYVPAHAVPSRAARSSHEPHAPAGERRYGPPWEILDAAEAPRR